MFTLFIGLKVTPLALSLSLSLSRADDGSETFIQNGSEIDCLMSQSSLKQTLSPLIVGVGAASFWRGAWFVLCTLIHRHPRFYF